MSAINESLFLNNLSQAYESHSLSDPTFPLEDKKATITRVFNESKSALKTCPTIPELSSGTLTLLKKALPQNSAHRLTLGCLQKSMYTQICNIQGRIKRDIGVPDYKTACVYLLVSCVAAAIFMAMISNPAFALSETKILVTTFVVAGATLLMAIDELLGNTLLYTVPSLVKVGDGIISDLKARKKFFKELSSSIPSTWKEETAAYRKIVETEAPAAPQASESHLVIEALEKAKRAQKEISERKQAIKEFEACVAFYEAIEVKV